VLFIIIHSPILPWDVACRETDGGTDNGAGLWVGCHQAFCPQLLLRGEQRWLGARFTSWSWLLVAMEGDVRRYLEIWKGRRLPRWRMC